MTYSCECFQVCINVYVIGCINQFVRSRLTAKVPRMTGTLYLVSTYRQHGWDSVVK